MGAVTVMGCKRAGLSTDGTISMRIPAGHLDDVHAATHSPGSPALGDGVRYTNRQRLRWSASTKEVDAWTGRGNCATPTPKPKGSGVEATQNAPAPPTPV